MKGSFKTKIADHIHHVVPCFEANQLGNKLIEKYMTEMMKLRRKNNIVFNNLIE